jgi:hypothetical protein
MKRTFEKKRMKLQKYTSPLFRMILLGGRLNPKAGFFLLLCMAGAIGL